MRKFLIMLSILAAGCAGQAASGPPTVMQAVPAGVKELPPQPDGTVDAQRVAEAKKMGYKLVNEDGQELYCRNDLKTGSRVHRELVCLSRKDIDDLRQQTQQGLANTMRQLPPPAGH